MNSNQYPDHWKIKPLNEIATVITGKTPPTKNYSCWNGSIPFITPKDLNGSLILATDRTITEEGLKFVKSLPYGTVLVSCIGYVGKVGVVGTSMAVTNQQINSAIPDEDILDSWYLAYALIFLEPYLRDLAGITTVPILNKSNFEMTNIPLPPLPEQRAIARALCAVQGAREARLWKVALERERKAALMEHLFTHGVRGEATKMTEIGEMPEGWELKSLGEIAKIERGKFTHRPRNDPAFYGGSTPFIQTGDVATCDGLIRAYSQTLNERGLSVSKVFPRGTIVITIAANIGFTGILEFDSAFPDSLIGITPSEEIDNRYLNYFLSTQQKKMDEMAPRGTQKNINIEFLSPWPAVVPPISEQKEIATILLACDSKIAALEHEACLLEELFRAMLEELMSGRLPAGALVEDVA